jgi:hypothetical protein
LSQVVFIAEIVAGGIERAVAEQTRRSFGLQLRRLQTEIDPGAGQDAGELLDILPGIAGTGPLCCAIP